MSILNHQKIAFCFLTIGDINHHEIWYEFFKNNKDKISIYVHPKHKDLVKSFFKDYIIKENIKTGWGNISLVDATNLLIKNALIDYNNYKIILVSDSCIPIKSFDYIYKINCK